MSGEGKSRDRLETVIEIVWLKKKSNLMETNWLNMLVDRGENKVTSFKLTKYVLATTYLDTLVLFSLKGILYSMTR